MLIGTASSSVMGVVSAGLLSRAPTSMLEHLAAKAVVLLDISSVKKNV